MYVWMYKLVPFYARRAGAASIFPVAVAATKIARIGQCQRQFAATLRSAKQLSMRDASFSHFLFQLFFSYLLPYDVFKIEHFLADDLGLINLFSDFADTVYGSDGIKMNTRYAVSHQFAALLDAPFYT